MGKAPLLLAFLAAAAADESFVAGAWKRAQTVFSDVKSDDRVQRAAASASRAYEAVRGSDGVQRATLSASEAYEASQRAAASAKRALDAAKADERVRRAAAAARAAAASDEAERARSLVGGLVETARSQTLESLGGHLNRLYAAAVDGVGDVLGSVEEAKDHAGEMAKLAAASRGRDEIREISAGNTATSHASSSSRLAASAADDVRHEGAREYLESFSGPLIRQIKAGGFFSDPRCEVPRRSAVLDAVPDELRKAAGPGAAIECGARVDFEAEDHFPGLHVDVRAEVALAPCERSVHVTFTAGDAHLPILVPAPRRLRFAPIDVCAPAGVGAGVGTLTPCVRFENATAAASGFAAVVNFVLKFELLGRSHAVPLPHAGHAVTLGDLDACELYDDCDACAADGACGWDAEAEACLAGDARGDACRTAAPCAWFFDGCPTPPTCAAKPHECGWCSKTSKCHHGDAAGPFQGFCSGRAWLGPRKGTHW